MLKHFFVGLFVVLLFPVLPIATSAKATQIGVIDKVTIDVPLSLDEKARVALIDKLTGLEKQRFIYLDLSINYKGTQPFSVASNDQPKPGTTKNCSNERLPMGVGLSYSLGPIAGYNHLLMTVYTGERAAFPYHDVSCEYTASGNHDQFRLRGFFHIIANAIPTATELQFRPFNPPFEIATQVLARK